jgi:methylaspartate mutase epsilon subunit
MLEPNTFSSFFKKLKKNKKLLIQPRFGFSNLSFMRKSLKAVSSIDVPTLGTILVDRFTRENDMMSLQLALQEGRELYGYPIVNYSPFTTRQLIKGIQDKHFFIQLKHGSPLPYKIFKAMVASGLFMTEGGPVSICLPFSTIPLSQSIAAWVKSAEFLAGSGEHYHIESLGGCLGGQLCPPSLLVALCILEALFFKHYGFKSISLSYTQGTHFIQDYAALKVLNALAEKYLKNIDWHCVLYTYLGILPKTVTGGKRILRDSVFLAKTANATRLVIRSPIESKRVPTVEEHLYNIWLSYLYRVEWERQKITIVEDKEEEATILYEAETLIQAVLNLHKDINESLYRAFKKGVLDIPYCPHPDNNNKTKSTIDYQGYLRGVYSGSLFYQKKAFKCRSLPVEDMIAYVQKKYDALEDFSS